jgi:hypothetical protein
MTAETPNVETEEILTFSSLNQPLQRMPFIILGVHINDNLLKFKISFKAIISFLQIQVFKSSRRVA